MPSNTLNAVDVQATLSVESDTMKLRRVEARKHGTQLVSLSTKNDESLSYGIWNLGGLMTFYTLQRLSSYNLTATWSSLT